MSDPLPVYHPNFPPEFMEHARHLARQRALEEEFLCLLAALVEHAVAHKAVADAHKHGHFPEALAHAVTEGVAPLQTAS
jgi:hypothetical protein